LFAFGIAGTITLLVVKGDEKTGAYRCGALFEVADGSIFAIKAPVVAAEAGRHMCPMCLTQVKSILFAFGAHILD